MTRQTAQPLEHNSLSATYRSARELVNTYYRELGMDLEPPYQRGDVWTDDQRIALIRSWLTGVPTGVVILSDRSTYAWKQAHGGVSPLDSGEPMYAVIDGKQRITTAIKWYSGELAVPASWLAPEWVETTEDTEDGPYVRYTGLTVIGQRKVARIADLQVAEAQPTTLEEEAAIYLLVNGGGTPQTADDMANAAGMAVQQ